MIFAAPSKLKYSNTLKVRIYRNVWICKRAYGDEVLIFLVVPVNWRAINRSSSKLLRLKNTHPPFVNETSGLLRLTDFTSKQIEQVIRKFSFKRSTLTRNKFERMEYRARASVKTRNSYLLEILSSPLSNDFKSLLSLSLTQFLAIFIYLFFKFLIPFE